MSPLSRRKRLAFYFCESLEQRTLLDGVRDGVGIVRGPGIEGAAQWISPMGDSPEGSFYATIHWGDGSADDQVGPLDLQSLYQYYRTYPARGSYAATMTLHHDEADEDHPDLGDHTFPSPPPS